ncbi:MAG: glycosyltransferase family 87 protein [Thermoanaerobaculia bacterium]
MREIRSRLVWIALASLAATEALLQAGRALFHGKQGLDLAPPYLAAKLLLRADRRFYDDSVMGAAGSALGLHGPAGPGDSVLNFIYPPWVPAAYAPLALLPWGAARVVWFLLSAAATIASILLLARATARDPEEARDLSRAALFGTAFFFPVFYGLMTGQANAVLLLLLAGSLLALGQGRAFLAGLLLAPAALVKPFLAFPALVFLARRAWGAVAGFAFSAGLLALLGVAVGGPRAWPEWWTQIAAHNAFRTYEPRNHSLAAAALALFGPGDGVTPVVPLPALAAPAAFAGTALAGFLVLLALSPRFRTANPALAFGATLAFGLLLTPKSWEHYGVFLLPGFLAAFASFRDGEGPPPRAALILLGASFSVWAFALVSREEYVALARRPFSLLLTSKAAATLVLLGLLAWAARRRAAAGGGGS